MIVNKKISNFIPKTGKELSLYSGSKIIERLGEDVIRSVVASILSGGNVRSLTESLTRRRLNLSNGAMLITFIKCLKNIENFSQNLDLIITKELKNKNDKETKMFLNWLVGLTGKSIQNVLRSDDTEFQYYLRDLNASLEKSVLESSKIYGEITATIIDKENQKYFLKWPEILQLFTAIGAQTLTIRGSEKSIYGKFFEKLVLGSLLNILGFKLLENNSKCNKKIFWLSQREDKRESDATLIIEPGIGVRFDIGFIGSGNTEISLDKVSRFEREIEMGRQRHYMSTIILVDRIGEKSRIVEMAKNIDGTIIQMSMSNWVKEVAFVLKETTKFKSEILLVPDESLKNYIEKKMQEINLNYFISNKI